MNTFLTALTDLEHAEIAYRLFLILSLFFLVLDMARHIPLYRAVLQVLRSLAVSPQLAALLLPSDRRVGRQARNPSSSGDALSATCLLNKMKSCVDTYASRLRLNRSKGVGRKSGSSAGASTSRISNKFNNSEDWEQDEGLAQLIADIQHTASMVTVSYRFSANFVFVLV